MKANQRFKGKLRTHALNGDYKIPIEDRKKFMGSNSLKWVDKKKYKKYLEWKKENL